MHWYQESFDFPLFQGTCRSSRRWGPACDPCNHFWHSLFGDPGTWNRTVDVTSYSLVYIKDILIYIYIDSNVPLFFNWTPKNLTGASKCLRLGGGLSSFAAQCGHRLRGWARDAGAWVSSLDWWALVAWWTWGRPICYLNGKQPNGLSIRGWYCQHRACWSVDYCPELDLFPASHVCLPKGLRAVASNFCRTTHDLDTMVCKNNTSCDWLPPFDGNYIDTHTHIYIYRHIYIHI